MKYWHKKITPTPSDIVYLQEFETSKSLSPNLFVDGSFYSV